MAKLDEEIIKLKNATYFSFSTDVFYDKKNGSYLNIKRDGLSFILDYRIGKKNVKGESKAQKCSVQFNKLFIDNIRYQYFKYFKPDEFFSLPSRGITRRLYKYLKVNTFNLKEAHIKYIKRSYDTLANSIPISPSSPSKVKEKLKSAMPHLLEFRVISDYFFADEYIINNTSENSIYFILEGKKEDLKRELETISIDDEVLSQGITLYIPTDLKKELEDIGVSKAKISSILKNYSKWDIIKYLLWLKEELAKTGGSPKNNPAGLFIFALEGGMVNLASCHQHILDFINKEKTKEDQERASTEDELLDKYNKYIEHSIKLYKKNHETEYTIIKNNILSSMKVDIPNHIKQSKLILDSMSDEDEKKKIQHLIDEENEFLKKGVKSVKFKKSLNKALSLVIGLKSFSDFKTDYLLKK